LRAPAAAIPEWWATANPYGADDGRAEDRQQRVAPEPRAGRYDVWWDASMFVKDAGRPAAYAKVNMQVERSWVLSAVQSYSALAAQQGVLAVFGLDPIWWTSHMHPARRRFATPQ